MLVSTATPPSPDTVSSPAPAATLERFLADIGPRAFRFAEAGLRHREDALDAVQDAMMKMLAYADRPAEEWTPLFWSILRRRIVDLQRRASFRLRWLLPTGDRGEEGPRVGRMLEDIEGDDGVERRHIEGAGEGAGTDVEAGARVRGGRGGGIGLEAVGGPATVAQGAQEGALGAADLADEAGGSGMVAFDDG